MCLKQSFSHSKWVLQAILSLTVLSNCVFDSSNFDTTFHTGFTKFCSGFSGDWIGNLIRITKICLKQSFSHSKCVLQAILSQTVLSKYVSSSSNLTSHFILAVPNFVEFFQVIG